MESSVYDRAFVSDAAETMIALTNCGIGQTVRFTSMHANGTFFGSLFKQHEVSLARGRIYIKRAIPLFSRAFNEIPRSDAVPLYSLRMYISLYPGSFITPSKRFTSLFQKWRYVVLTQHCVNVSRENSLHLS